MDNSFLLHNGLSKKLYESLKDLPIFDYHNHLSAKEIYENASYGNITALWLGADHYKWRLMRNCGVAEKYITEEGSSDYDKFKTWAAILPKCIGNVILNWSQMELSRCFGIDDALNEETAESIWKITSAMLQEDAYKPRKLISKANISILCTTDDPIDSLEYHDLLQQDDDFCVKVLPTWRPDRLLGLRKDNFTGYIESLGKAAGTQIHNFDDLKEALCVRMDYFRKSGCVATDHSFAHIPCKPAVDSRVDEIFSKRMNSCAVTSEDEEIYVSSLLIYLAREYTKRNWVMQLHIGPIRNNNSRMYEAVGPDTGFDSVNDHNIAETLSGFLDCLDYSNELPKTILYALNEKDYPTLSTMIGNYPADGISGKIQLGPAWWFNDNIEGIRKHLSILANNSALSSFIGMVTDSRSVLSAFSRHELFRRILCDQIGEWVEEGIYPKDITRLVDYVRNIAYYNAMTYFNQPNCDIGE